MSAMYKSSWSETAWDTVFGPNATPASVRADAEREGVSASRYVTGAIKIAREQGGIPDGSDLAEPWSSGDLAGDLCRQLGVPRAPKRNNHGTADTLDPTGCIAAVDSHFDL